MFDGKIPERESTPLEKGTKPIQLYSLGTPNGIKIAALLEELGGEALYDAHKIDISKEEQFNPEFLRISPNNKIPAIYDQESDIAVMETGAIAIYLAEKYADRGGDKLLPKEPKARAEVMQWTMWQMGGLGPMFGQYGHFKKYAVSRVDNDLSKIEYGRKRYAAEVKRLHLVLEKQLEKVAKQNPGKEVFVCGDHITIADFMIHPWILCVERYYAGYNNEAFGIGPLSDFPRIKEYYDRLLERPSIQKGLKVTPF